MKPFERHLNTIANMITINKEDREIFTKDYDVIRDYVLGGMRKVDYAFRNIFGGTFLFGSHPNNVRIGRPDEFDVIFKLCLPFASSIILEPDPDRPGFIRLICDEFVDNLEDSNGYQDVIDTFDPIVDEEDSYLHRGKLQKWLQNLFEEVLNEYGCYVKGYWGDKYQLIYSKRGLAHTIYAKSAKRSISIDFVPGISVKKMDWMTLPKGRKFRHNLSQWYAVPKSSPGPKGTRKFAFQLVNPKVEHDLMMGKQNLKVVYRLLKALKTSYGLRKFKSYFLTTIFLWEICERPEEFWYQPLHEILEEMLDVLTDYFIDGFLPFFWNSDLNLLDNLSDDESEMYSSQLCKAYNTLKSYSDQPNLSFKACRRHFAVCIQEGPSYGIAADPKVMARLDRLFWLC